MDSEILKSPIYPDFYLYRFGGVFIPYEVSGYFTHNLITNNHLSFNNYIYQIVVIIGTLFAHSTTFTLFSYEEHGLGMY